MADLRIVSNKLLGGWYIVTGPYDVPLSGRFATRAEAKAYLERKRVDRDRKPRLVVLERELSRVFGRPK